MASLRELQRSFAASLRDPGVTCAVEQPANLAVYRNNSSITFRAALELTFPVVRRRVGDDYFRQLCAQYRERFPSRSGDLHWAGRDFAAFLDTHLAGSDYAWLAGLARLEWSRAECLVASESPAVGIEALGMFSSAALEHLVFGLQPTLRLHAFAFPVFTVWLSNQVDNAPPVNQSVGNQQGMVRCRYEAAEVRMLDAPLFSFLSALNRGATLGEAMQEASLDEAALREALLYIFSAGLVISLAPRA
jgi:Putative DNA-binding domain